MGKNLSGVSVGVVGVFCMDWVFFAWIECFFAWTECCDCRDLSGDHSTGRSGKILEGVSYSWKGTRQQWGYIWCDGCWRYKNVKGFVGFLAAICADDVGTEGRSEDVTIAWKVFWTLLPPECKKARYAISFLQLDRKTVLDFNPSVLDLDNFKLI